MSVDFFSIQLDWSFPGRVKGMVVDQFLVRGEIIGLKGEILFMKRLRAGGRTEVCTI